jgi:hypothetical protein
MGVYFFWGTSVVTFATEDGEFIGETRLNPERDYQPKGDGFAR